MTTKRTLIVTIYVEHDDDADPLGKELMNLEQDLSTVVANCPCVVQSVADWAEQTQQQEGGN